MRHIRIIVCLLSLFLVACEGTTFQSSVPAYPVRVVIDTKQGAFVHFQPTVTGSYITVDRDGYYMNGSFVLPLGVTDMYGTAALWCMWICSDTVRTTWLVRIVQDGVNADRAL